MRRDRGSPNWKDIHDEISDMSWKRKIGRYMVQPRESEGGFDFFMFFWGVVASLSESRRWS